MSPTNLRYADQSITIPTIEDLTRRDFMFSAFGAALLIACGDDDPDEAPEGATRQVQDLFGTVEVPVSPQRVLLLGHQVAGNAVFLGFPVDRIAGVAWGGPDVPNIEYLPEHEALAQVPNAGEIFEPDLERIVALEPDLIIHFGFDNESTRQVRERYDLTGIPVFTVYNGYASLDDTMRFLRDIATALNLEDRAAEEEAKLRAAVEDVRRHLAGREMPAIATIRPFPDGNFWANSSALLEALNIPGPRPTPEERSVQFSEERLIDLDVDFIIVYGSGDDTPEDARRLMEASPVWRSLAAVSEDRVRYVETTAWLNWTVPALYLGLADIEVMLAG